jgi:hypothetical protein
VLCELSSGSKSGWWGSQLEITDDSAISVFKIVTC